MAASHAVLPPPVPETQGPSRAATPPAPPPLPRYAVLARLCWMLFGPFVLLLSLLALVNTGKSFFSVADVVFLAALGAMLLGRWVEVRSGHGRTATGEPATAGHLRRYLLGATFIGLSIWVATLVARWAAGQG